MTNTGQVLIDALIVLKHVLLDLKAEQIAGHIVDAESYAAAGARRTRIAALRKRFHLLTKAIDDIDRRRMETWEARQRNERWRAAPRSSPKLLPQGRRGSGRFTKRNLYEVVS